MGACPFNGSIREISCRRHHDGRGWISFTDRFIRDARELPLVTLFRLIFYTREPNEISVSKSREFTFYRHFFSCQEVPDAWIMDGPFKLLKKGFSNFNCSWGLGQLRLRGQIASRWNRRQWTLTSISMTILIRSSWLSELAFHLSESQLYSISCYATDCYFDWLFNNWHRFQLMIPTFIFGWLTSQDKGDFDLGTSYSLVYFSPIPG